MEFGILGPLLVRRGDDVLDIRARKQRTVLLRLLLDPGRAVSTDTLIDDVWSGRPPPQALVTLRSYISNLRSALRGQDGETVVVTRGRGYALAVEPDRVDAIRFERSVKSAHADLADGRAERALATFDPALALWRGPALEEVADELFARGHVVRLEELRLTAEEGRCECLLQLGRHLEAVAELEAFVVRHPLRERARGQLVLALYRSGRAPDALASHREFCELLTDELGMDPSPAFARLAQLVLQQSDELELRHAPTAVTVRPSAVTGHFRLVGRERERGRLLAAVSAAVDGRGRLVLVGGSAGIGKTALLQDLAATAQPQGVRVHWGRAPEAVGTPPFWSWVQILGSIADEVDDEELRRLTAGPAAGVTQLSPLLGERLGGHHVISADDSSAARFRLLNAVVTFLERAAERTPFVLALEDLHWADDGSLELLTVLAPRLGGARIAAIATYRDLSTEHRGRLGDALAALAREDVVEEVTLAGLSTIEVAEMLMDLVDEDDVAAHAELLHERSDGNPFFVRQLARLLDDGRTTPATALSDLPPGIRHVLQLRLERVPEAVRQLLDVGAVLGREFDLRHAAQILQVDAATAADAVDIAVQHGLADRSGPSVTTYRFVHALLRETIYETMPPGRVAQLHARAGMALEQDRNAEMNQVAEHFWRSAELIDDDRPMRAALDAARRAADVLSYEVAEEQLRRALDLVGRHPAGSPRLELEIRLRLLELANNTQRWTDASVAGEVDRVQVLARDHGIGADLAPLWWSLRTFTTIRGEPAVALQLSRALGADGQEHGDTATIAAGHVGAAVGLTAMGHLEPALGELRDAEAQLEKLEGEGEDTLAAESLETLHATVEATIAAVQGDARATERATTRALAAADARGSSFAQTYGRWCAALAAASLGRVDVALAHAQASLALSAEHGFTTLVQMVTPVQAWALAQRGQDPLEQASRAAEALAWLRAVGHRHREPQLLALLADIHRAAGQRDEARRSLTAARTAAIETGEHFYDRHIDALAAAAGAGAPAVH